MDSVLHILHLEDDPADVRLVRDTLAAEGVDAEMTVATNRADFLAALDHNGTDLILADYALPAFDGLEALALCRAHHLDKPFIFVTGAMGEDRAIETLRSGATDYVLKARLNRLAPAVRRAIAEAREHAHCRQTQEALRTSEERYRRFFEEDLTGDFIATPDGHVIKCNPAFAEIYGLGNPVAATGCAIAEFNPEDWVDLTTRVRKVRRIHNYQCTHQRPDGNRIHVVANIVGRFAQTGELTEVVGYVFDDTERKEMEAELRRLNGHLEEKVRAKTRDLQDTVDCLQEEVTRRLAAEEKLHKRACQLQKLTLQLSQAEERERRRVAAILHDDLQQILAGTKFHLDLLSGSPKSQQRVQEVIAQVKQMLTDAIEKSRDLSHELSPAVLYQCDLRETCEWLARHMQEKHGLTVHVETRGDVNSRSEPLKGFLYRAAQELLFNVIKHAGVKQARLRLRRVRDQLRLTISDRGHGFEIRSLAETAGFGLLTIRERVESLGGHVKIRSAPDKGSTFLVTLPDEPQDTRHQTEDQLLSSTVRPPSSESQPPSSTQTLSVLLVDDHKVMREGLVLLLKNEPDIKVTGQATNGREAVDLACQLRPDVVIMDVAMPEMGGQEATRRIKGLLPQTRIIALSMFEEPGVAQDMLEAGAEAYLPKTGAAEDLLAAIRRRVAPNRQ